MAPELNTTTQSSSQTTTQSPQSAVGSGSVGGTQTGSVQSGTPTDLLNNQPGIPLADTPLSTVNLQPSTTATNTAQPPVSKHHVNAGLLSFSALLILIAIILFIVAGRSVKSTT